MLPNDIFNKKNCIDLIFTRNSLNVLIMSFFFIQKYFREFSCSMRML